MNDKTSRLKLELIFSEVSHGDYHASSQLEEGKTPLISCKTEKTPEHGVEGYFKIPREKIYRNCVTITCDGDQPSTASFHPYDIAVKDNVLICKPKQGIKLTTLLYAISCINKERWRFSYGRKCYRNKFDLLTVPFPVDSKGKIDQKRIDEILDSNNFLPIVSEALNTLKELYNQH